MISLKNIDNNITSDITETWLGKPNIYFKKRIKEKLDSQEINNLIVNEIQKKISKILDNIEVLKQNTISPPIEKEKDKNKNISYIFDNNFDDIFKQLTLNER